MFHGQYRQDEILNTTFFKNKRNGIFLDIGADDGISLSNTHFYEKQLGWKGLLFEPNSDMYLEAVKIRNNPVLNIALSNKDGVVKYTRIRGYARTLSGITETYDPKYNDPDGRINSEIRDYGGSREEIEVVCLKLDTVLRMHGITEVDFVSLDVEGHELQILEGLDFSKHKLKVITMENNFDEPRHREFMAQRDYKLYGKIHIDDVYVLRGCEYDI